MSVESESAADGVAGGADRAGGASPLPPDDRWSRPPGVTDATVVACGKLGEALEWLERARGRLYDFHQMIGRADFLFGDASELLAEAGHQELADLVERDVVGRNVLAGRWSFQIVEDFDDGYYQPIADVEARVRNDLVGGRRHVYEAELKEERRTHGRRRHESRPSEGGTAGDGGVAGAG
ncbi:MAG TPA: hypothetical protein VIL48_18330 [Acidimicrobiales bacterium]